MDRQVKRLYNLVLNPRVKVNQIQYQEFSPHVLITIKSCYVVQGVPHEEQTQAIVLDPYEYSQAWEDIDRRY